MSSFTLPACTLAPPVTVRMAPAIVSGVASTGRTLMARGSAPITAVPPARPRKRRRVEVARPCIPRFPSCLFAQRRQIGHNILNLIGRQDRLVAESLRHALEPVHAVIRRHDGPGVEAGGIDQPEPELALRPTAASA